MEFNPALSSFSPLVARAAKAFGTDFRYAEAIAKHASALPDRDREASERRALTPAA